MAINREPTLNLESNTDSPSTSPAMSERSASPEQNAESGEEEQPWINRVKKARDTDKRKQPWSEVYGAEVADRNPCAYSKQEDAAADLFKNGGIDLSHAGESEAVDDDDRIISCGGGSGTFSG